MKPLHAVNKKRGFSLVELMVAMVLGLILIGGVIQVFLSNKLTFENGQGVARMQESARFVLAEIARDLRMAGYRGCNSGNVTLANLIKSSGSADDFLGFAESLAGYDAQNSQWSSSNASSVATITDISPDADRLVIKNLGRDLMRLSAPLDSNATSVSVEAVKNLTVDDLLFIGDCEKGATVAVTGISGSTISFGAAENLNQDLTADKSRFVTGDTLVHKLETKSYFIARSQAYVNNRGSVPWSLWRKVNKGTAVEMATGVENLQVLYGVDTNGDGVQDTFVPAGSSINMENVVVARIQVTTNGIDEGPEGPVSRTFSLTVRLRNRLTG